MLSLSRRADYALVALATLARRYPGTTSARQIAEASQVPQAMLMNILKDLQTKGLVASTRGTKGGYRLARPARDITMAQLIASVEGPLQLAMCCRDESRGPRGNCDLETHCPTKEPLQRMNGILQQFLEQISLVDLLSNTVPLILRVTSGSRRPAPRAPAGGTV